MTEQWLAVRCCCTPKKILGFLRVPAELVGNGRSITLYDRGGNGHRVELLGFDDDTSICAMPQVLRRNLRDVDLGRRKREFAVYSDDRPIEFWRNFAEFVATAER